MADEPKFPSPDEAKRKNDEVKIVPPTAPVVVQRAEPAPESKDAKAKLSPEEVRALLAVSEVNRPRQAWKRRGRTIAIPTILLSVVAHLFLSYWPIAVGLLVVGALVWTFGPWKKKEDEW